MRRLTTFFTILMLCVTALFAQAPEKFTYQAVVRNTDNQLVTNTQVGVQVLIMKDHPQGGDHVAYGEWHGTFTNANGLITLNIGEGNPFYGNFNQINWKSGVFFIDVGIDLNGGSDYTIWSTQQLLSVPFALYANEAGNSFSGDYNDLINKPVIPTVPTNVSAFNNDAGYLTGYTETDPQFNAWDKDYNDLTNLPQIPQIPADISAFNNDVPYLTAEQQILSISHDTIFLTGGSFVKLPAGFDGDYNSLTNTPDIPTVPTNVSSFNNDAGYLTGYTETDPQFNAWDKDYNDLTNLPQIPQIPADISAFNNDVPYLTAEQQILSISHDTIFLTGGSFVKLPAGFDGDYNSLTNTPDLNQLTDSVMNIILIMQQQWQQQQMQMQQQIDSLNEQVSQIPHTENTTWNTSVTNETVCDSLVWHGETHTESGIYLYGWTDAEGINNMEALNLTVQHPVADLVEATACEAYTWNNTTYEESGDYQQTFTSANGCDSIVTLHLTIYNGTHNVFMADTCESYVWNGQTYTESGTYTYAYTNVNGCASVDTLHLTIHHGTHNVDTVTACESYTWHDSTYTQSGTYTYLYDDEYGCASEDTLKLTVYQGCTIDEKSCPGTATVTDIDGNMYGTVQIGEQCWMRSNLRVTRYADGTAVPAGNMNFSKTEPYYYDFSGQGGDGTSQYFPLSKRGYLYNWPAAMHGTASSNTNPSQVQGICPNGWHVPSDAEWTQLENYVTSQSQYVCGGDKIANALTSTLGWKNFNSSSSCFPGNNPSANNATGFNAMPVGCYTYNGYQTATELTWFLSSTENDSASIHFCMLWYNGPYLGRFIEPKDYGYSVRCLKDTISSGGNPPCIGTHNVETETSCESYTWHGQTYGESGTYTYSYTNDGGCASVDTLHLTIHYPVAELVEATACESYTWNEQTFTQSGDYTQTFTAANGCDSVVTLHLTIHHPVAELVEATACESYTWNGQPYTQSGDYTQTFTAANGCDSVVTLQLTINHGTHTFITENACDSFTWHGVTYTESGDYIHHYTNEHGCPSTTTLRLTIYEPEYAIVTDTACEQYEWHYTVYTESGTYRYRHHDSNGCLVWDTLYLTINKGTHNVTDTTVCESFTWHGTNLTESNTYLYAYTNENGCSSMDTLKLTIQDVLTFATTAAACDTFTWHGQNYTQSGSYIHTDTNEQGCPIVDTLYLTINKGTHNVTDTITCENFTWHGNNLTESNTYLYAYTDENGCSSMDTLHLTVHYGTHTVFTVTACESYTWCDSLLDHSGTYYCLYENEYGCPSADTLFLTVLKPVGEFIEVISDTIYTWHDSTYAESGIYFYAYTDENNCSVVDTLSLTIDTTECGGGQPCPGMPTVTDHEGNVYSTVQIGSQCWMKENMRCYTSPSTGSNLVSSKFFASQVSKSATYPNKNESNVPTYGVLYNWCAAMDIYNQAIGCPEIADSVTMRQYMDSIFEYTAINYHRGICPSGWHIPSDADWKQLAMYVFNNDCYRCGDCNYPINYKVTTTCIGKALASTTGWEIFDINTYVSDNFWGYGGTTCYVGYNPSTNNATGFSAMPAGYVELYMYHDSTHTSTGLIDTNWVYSSRAHNFGEMTRFWSSTDDYNDNTGNSFSLQYDDSCGIRRSRPTSRGQSVRCVRNEAILPDEQ